MKIYNTLTRKKETFEAKENEIKMYVCGPTVYDVGHLGHGRAAMCFDLIRRYFLYKGLKVKYVSNVTDVDDKMIKRAAEEHITEKELAEKIIPEYERDYAALNVMPPTNSPRATEYIKEMVELVESLMEKGYAYKTSDGVYFEVSRFREYGKLSGQKLDELQSGARIAVDEKKKSPLDFTLWKAAKEGEPAWAGPAGIKGRPGWHIECSAMSKALLGETFDIHGGGADLIFPHHECEIAQSEAATGKKFARFWMHNGHIKVNKEKMSKSLGNFFTIKDILKKYDPAVVRYFLISTHYRLPIDFSDDLLSQSRNGLQRLRDFMIRLQSVPSKETKKSSENISKYLKEVKKDFDAAMDDDFNIAEALAVIFDLIKKVNSLLDQNKISAEDLFLINSEMKNYDSVFGVLASETKVDDKVEKLIEERNAARKNKDFKKSDEIRKELEKKGIILEDTPGGTVWKKEL